MGFFSWLFAKGIAGAISRDLVKKYLGLKQQHLIEDDKKILIRVWNFWLTLNEVSIRSEDGLDKIARLDIIKAQYSDNESELNKLKLSTLSLFDIYRDVLYIETEISSGDGKIYDKASQVFLNESMKMGLDLSKEYEAMKRGMTSAGLID